MAAVVAVLRGRTGATGIASTATASIAATTAWRDRRRPRRRRAGEHAWQPSLGGPPRGGRRGGYRGVPISARAAFLRGVRGWSATSPRWRPTSPLVANVRLGSRRAGVSPLDAHVATPQELRERIAAERRGTPFLLYRDGDDQQAIVDLERGRRAHHDRPAAEQRRRARLGRARSRACTPRSSASATSWTVVDDGLSHNGTLRQRRARDGRRRLHDGDVIAIGETLIAFRAPPEGSIVSAPTVDRARPARRRAARRPRSGASSIALCRPFKDCTYATPAVQPADRRRARASASTPSRARCARCSRSSASTTCRRTRSARASRSRRCGAA